MKLALLRCLVIALILLKSVLCASAAQSSQGGGSFHSERDYIRVIDWVHQNHLEVHWLKKDESLRVTGRSSTISLTVDSSDASFNGINVRLLFPIAKRETVPYISRLDAQRTFAPLINPPRAEKPVAIKTICLDPGHGGKEPGFLVRGNMEKKYTLLLAQELQAQLKKAGFKVFLTRTSDSFVELPERPQIAKRRGADLFISLHFNSATPSVRGAEVYCLTPSGAPSTNDRGEGADSGFYPGNKFDEKNMLLAWEMQKALTRNLEAEDRGVHRARFWVLRDAEMPAILIEGGFMSHPSEGKKIFDAAYRREMASAILQGVMDYKKTVEPRPAAPQHD